MSRRELRNRFANVASHRNDDVMDGQFVGTVRQVGFGQRRCPSNMSATSLADSNLPNGYSYSSGESKLEEESEQPRSLKRAMSDSRAEQRRYLGPPLASASSPALPIQFLNTLSHLLTAELSTRLLPLVRYHAHTHAHVHLCSVSDSADILVPSIWYPPW